LSSLESNAEQNQQQRVDFAGQVFCRARARSHDRFLFTRVRALCAPLAAFLDVDAEKLVLARERAVERILGARKSACYAIVSNSHPFAPAEARFPRKGDPCSITKHRP
jgi:hypothetical protein